jgi:hypothetical protein
VPSDWKEDRSRSQDAEIVPEYVDEFGHPEIPLAEAWMKRGSETLILWCQLSLHHLTATALAFPFPCWLDAIHAEECAFNDKLHVLSK